MKSFHISALLILLNHQSFAEEWYQDWYQRWSRAGANWHDRWMNLADGAAAMPPEERIGLLGRALVVGEKGKSSPQEAEVYKRIRGILLHTPGHARHFGNAIKSQLSKLESAPDGEEWKYRSQYDSIQNEGFKILGQLPSSETVRVLGGFLYDEAGGLDQSAGRAPTVDEIVFQQKRNCDKAAATLLKLIDNPPVKDVGWLKPGDLETLRLWYEQVLAGNRTFRFKGDSSEYGLDGPTTAGTIPRTGKVLDRNKITSEGGRNPVEVSSVTAEADGSGRRPPVAEILAGLALAAAAVWYFLRRRSVR